MISRPIQKLLDLSRQQWKLNKVIHHNSGTVSLVSKFSCEFGRLITNERLASHLLHASILFGYKTLKYKSVLSNRRPWEEETGKSSGTLRHFGEFDLIFAIYAPKKVKITEGNHVD